MGEKLILYYPPTREYLGKYKDGHSGFFKNRSMAFVFAHKQHLQDYLDRATMIANLKGDQGQLRTLNHLKILKHERKRK